MHLGGYLPRIIVLDQARIPAPPQLRAEERTAKHFDRHKVGWMLGGSLGLLGVASIARLTRPQHSLIDRLWEPIFATKTPLLIFIPILTERSDGTLSDRVGIGTAATLRRAADFLTSHNYPYHLRFGADLTYTQMREQPSLKDAPNDWPRKNLQAVIRVPIIGTTPSSPEIITTHFW